MNTLKKLLAASGLILTVMGTGTSVMAGETTYAMRDRLLREAAEMKADLQEKVVRAESQLEAERRATNVMANKLAESQLEVARLLEEKDNRIYQCHKDGQEAILRNSEAHATVMAEMDATHDAQVAAQLKRAEDRCSTQLAEQLEQERYNRQIADAQSREFQREIEELHEQEIAKITEAMGSIFTDALDIVNNKAKEERAQLEAAHSDLIAKINKNNNNVVLDLTQANDQQILDLIRAGAQESAAESSRMQELLDTLSIGHDATVLSLNQENAQYAAQILATCEQERALTEEATHKMIAEITEKHSKAMQSMHDEAMFKEESHQKMVDEITALFDTAFAKLKSESQQAMADMDKNFNSCRDQLALVRQICSTSTFVNASTDPEATVVSVESRAPRTVVIEEQDGIITMTAEDLAKILGQVAGPFEFGSIYANSQMVGANSTAVVAPGSEALPSVLGGNTFVINLK